MKITIEEVFEKSDKEIELEIDTDGDLVIRFNSDEITISQIKLREAIKFLNKEEK